MPRLAFADAEINTPASLERILSILKHPLSPVKIHIDDEDDIHFEFKGNERYGGRINPFAMFFPAENPDAVAFTPQTVLFSDEFFRDEAAVILTQSLLDYFKSSKMSFYMVASGLAGIDDKDFTYDVVAEFNTVSGRNYQSNLFDYMRY